MSNGDAIVIWQGNGAVAARLYRGSGWLDIEPVAAADARYSAYEHAPKVAVRPDGSLIVAYHEAPTSASRVVCTRERDPDGAWLPPSTLAMTGLGWWQEPDPPSYELTSDGSGNVTALVRALRSDVMATAWPVGLLAFGAPAGNRFGEPTVLSTAYILDFGLTANAGTGLLAVWGDDSTQGLRSASFSSTTGWAEDPSPGLGRALAATPEADGSISVLSARRVNDVPRLETATRAPEGTWSAVTDLGDVPDGVDHAELVAEPSGRAIATRTSWLRGPGCSYASAVARRDASSAWTSWEEIPGSQPGTTAIAKAARSPSGHALIAWAQRSTDRGCAGSAYYLSWISPSGMWSPRMLLDAGPVVNSAAIALTPTGRALVAWRHDDLVLVRWIDPP